MYIRTSKAITNDTETVTGTRYDDNSAGIGTKIVKNGVTLYYFNGKRIAKADIYSIVAKKHRELICNEFAAQGISAAEQTDKAALNNEFFARIELHDAFICGWNEFSFASEQEATDAAEKIKAAFGKKFCEAEIYHKKGFYGTPTTIDKITADELEQSADTVIEIDGYDESAFDLLPTVDELNGIDDDAKRIVTENQLPEVKPEFKRYGSFKNKTAHIDAAVQILSKISELRVRVHRLNDEIDGDIFARDKIETPAEAMRLIESVARDEFATRLEELTAEFKEAEIVRHNAVEKYKDAEEALAHAEILVDRKREAIAKFGQACAKNLEEKLIDNTLIYSPKMKVTNQDGSACETNFEQITIFFHDAYLKFYVVTDWIHLGEYDTPAQVETVINELKAANERGDNEFTFPTVDELTGTENSKMTA